MRRFLVIGGLLLGVAGGADAGAADSPGAQRPRVQRHGPACPPLGCARETSAPASAVAGFAAAVLASAGLSRRRRGDTH